MPRLCANLRLLLGETEEAAGRLVAPLPVINHMQLADLPDPHEPGTGKSVEITSFGASTSSAMPAGSAANTVQRCLGGAPYLKRGCLFLSGDASVRCSGRSGRNPNRQLCRWP